jgi:ankyrin repeat protein
MPWRARALVGEASGDRLFAVVEAGDLASIKTMLATQPSLIYARDADDGREAIHLAAFHDHAELLRYLIDQGADINSKDAGGCTPLHLASRWGHTGMVRLLLELGGDGGLRDREGWTPLITALYGNHTETAQVLQEADSASPAKDRGFWGSLHSHIVDAFRQLHPSS